MITSNSSSPLVLLAIDPRDAEGWQAEHPELARHVHIVFVDRVRDALEGATVTAAYCTERASLHPYWQDATTLLLERIAKSTRYRDEWRTWGVRQIRDTEPQRVYLNDLVPATNGEPVAWVDLDAPTAGELAATKLRLASLAVHPAGTGL